jgi:ATP-dependent protease ClpP protease subunit
MTDPETKAAAERRDENQFPRSRSIPPQSPKYWAKEKDRYIRQLLIGDIEEITGRSLLVYFSVLSEQIGHTDPDDLSEIIQGLDSKDADLFIQTPGGNVDATEKIISVLRKSLSSYRVIVPSWAKSAGTVIALSSSKIILGVNSELGPIDPQFRVNGAQVSAELLANDPKLAKHLQDHFRNAYERMRRMAEVLLTGGMMKGRPANDVADTLNKISSVGGYLSHGAVIDFDEAKSLGLDVEYLDTNNDLWQRIWLLYCLYDHDAKVKNLAKIIEGSRFSISRPQPS